MKANQFIAMNALIAMAVGIAFALYGPLMLAFFGTPELQGAAGEAGDVQALLYWTVASFARLFGAALFSFGLLLWAVRPIFHSETASKSTLRGVLFALLLSNAGFAIVAATQQFSVWDSSAGLILMMIFSVLALGYGFSLARFDRE